MKTQNPEKLRTAQLVWMQYYNRTLYEKGVITEQEFNRMRLRIQERYAPRGRTS